MLEKKNVPELHTRRYTLSEVTVDDIDEVHVLLSDENISRYLGWSVSESIHDTGSRVRDWILMDSSRYTYRWLIWCGNRKDAHGLIVVKPFGNMLTHAKVEVLIRDGMRNNGIATEALDEVANYIFNEFGIHSLVAEHFKDNKAAGRVLQKCGFSRTWWRPTISQDANDIKDAVQYAIIAHPVELNRRG